MNTPDPSFVIVLPPTVQKVRQRCSLYILVVCTCDCDDSCELSLSRVLRIDMICLMNRSTSVVSCPHLSSAVLVLFCWLVNAYNKEGDRSVNTKKIVQNSVADLECSLFR